MLLAGAVSFYLPDGQAVLLQDSSFVLEQSILMQCRGDWPFLKQLFAGSANATNQTRHSPIAQLHKPFEFLTDLVAQGIDRAT